MQEVLWEAVRPLNLPWTILLALVAIYWLLVALGAFTLDLEHGDGGPDLDGDAGDFEAEAGDASSHGQVEAGWLSHVLHFLNVGEVPVTIVLSVFALCAWLFSMIANHYWTGGSTAIGLAALLPNFLLSAVVTRYVTAPFKPLLRALNREGDEHVPIVGRTCVITTSEANPNFGQGLISTKGAPLLVNIRTVDGVPLPRGSSGLIVRRDEARGIYFVVPVTPDNLE